MTKKITILIFVLFVLSRLPNLGNDTFNTDSWKWKARIYDFGSAVFSLQFEKTNQTYHPGVSLMWIGTVGVKAYNSYYDLFLHHTPKDNAINVIFELNFVLKFLIAMVLGLVISNIYYLLEKLFDRKYALVSVVLLALEPLFAALSREIHLEALLSVFMIASFLWCVYFLENTNKNSRLFFSGFFCALAVLTKTSALFLLPFIGLILFLHYLFNGKKFVASTKAFLSHYYKWFFVTLLLFIILWPAMWVTPANSLKTLYNGIVNIGVEGGHEQLFFGRLYEDPGAAFYLVVLLVKTSPYLFIGLAGYILSAHRNFSQKTKRFALYAFLFAFLYFIEITISSKKLDRYILPSALSLLLIASFFFEWALSKLKEYFYVGLVLLFIPALYYFISLNPDYFSYYNPLTGGLKTGITVLEPKWMVGQTQIVEYLQNLKASEHLVDFAKGTSMDRYLDTNYLDNKLTVGFQEKYYTQIWPFIFRIGGSASIMDITKFARNTKYFVFPVWDDSSKLENRFKLVYLDTIKLRGVDLYRVYRKAPL